MKNSAKNKKSIITLIAILLILVAAFAFYKANEKKTEPSYHADTDFASLKFEGEPYIVLNDNIPLFEQKDITDKSFESYGKLDKLGRCTACMASVGKDIMPTEKRGDIGMIKPTGWKTAKYDTVDGKYLYNRCHLIGFQLTGENANEKNLITGTRYMNVDGMLPFENMVADYVKETGNHCMYRVTPVFIGDELVARGVTMEAKSVEDGGEGICFYVYCFNNQPEIEIDYASGESRFIGKTKTESSLEEKTETYILNTSSKKFHKPGCSAVKDVKPQNKKEVKKTRSELISEGYEPCGGCKP
ncbi:MAG: DNA/RNA non-specific endonuclease [Clostridiales bacterium]|nr:DNA/RNA non-specific endonuclease [Candidatus Equinaster intestinalis]